MNQIFYLVHYTLNGLRKDTANNSDICFNGAKNQKLKRKIVKVIVLFHSPSLLYIC